MSNPKLEYIQLLKFLKATVEGLLMSHLSNVWNIYGGLNRLFTAIERIFKHGFSVYTHEGEADCWSFIEGLKWLQPSQALSHTSDYDGFAYPVLKSLVKQDKAVCWIYKSLEEHSLSSKLECLLSDVDHVSAWYEKHAFLRQTQYVEATLTCLKAVETNQPSLLININPSLFVMNDLGFEKSHRRSYSLPEAQAQPVRPVRRKILQTLKSEHSYTLDCPTMEPNKQAVENTRKPEVLCCEAKSKPKILYRSKSLPSVIFHTEVDVSKHRRNTLSFDRSNPFVDVPLSSKISPSILKVDYSSIQESPCEKLKKFEKSPRYEKHKNRYTGTIKKCQLPPNGRAVRKRNLSACVVTRPTLLELYPETDETVSESYSSLSKSERSRRSQISPSSAPEYVGEWLIAGVVVGKKEPHKTTFMEDGGNSVLPMSTGYFPQPTRGQSLMSFLSSGQFSRANAELDRENAHFSISEAIIAAIEQVKCNKKFRIVDEIVEESDEEINQLKQRIRLRRRQKQEEGQKQKGVWSLNLLSDGKTDTTTTDQSVSPLSTTPESVSDSISTDDVEDLEIDEASNLQDLKNSAMSITMASLYSEADLSRASSRPGHATDLTLTNLSDSVVSAENVALSLLRQFHDKQLPRASDLEWLVSEEEAPQQLLPMPASWPVSPDEAESCNMQTATTLRGTSDWAPPRAQVIFTSHPPPVRRVLLSKQNYRCAGCGLKVLQEYSHHFRYCEYLGRYFCTGCHSNKVALIPGKILTKWNFSRYPVSTFSYKLLDQMSTDPLFQLNDLNPGLYKKVKQLERARQTRLQLYHIKDFINTCRFAEKLQEELHKEPSHILTDIHSYSLQDLVQVQSGDLIKRLKLLISQGISHVEDCPLCQARGFICELCSTAYVIFPWQLEKVIQCERCGACFHKACFKTGFCPRCTRIDDRRRSNSSSV